MGHKTAQRIEVGKALSKDAAVAESKASTAAWEAALAARLRDAAAGKSLREIALMTGCNWETVRRYLARGRVGGRFLVLFCDAFEVNAEWLLHGVGPVHRARDRSVGAHAAILTAILEVKQGRVDVRQVKCES